MKNERQIEIIKEIQSGDKRHLSELIDGVYGYIISVANKFNNNYNEVEDRISDGLMGMLYAVEKFDTTKDNTFLTYASSWIYNYIQQGVKNEQMIIKTPQKTFYNVSSFNDVIGGSDEDLTVEDVIGTEDEKLEDRVEKAQLKDLIKDVMNSLSDEELIVITYSYGFVGKELSLEEISERYSEKSLNEWKDIKENALIKLFNKEDLLYI